MIDTHVHLTDAAFDPDLEAVLARANAVGVDRFAVVGQDYAENEAVLALAAQRDDCLAFLGLHPDRWADRHAPETLPNEAAVTRILEQIRQHRKHITGIGEVGLDYWVCQQEDRRAMQAQALAQFAGLSLALDLPMNVHARAAGLRTLEMLLGLGVRRVLMHSFDGKAGHALLGAEAGYV